MVLEKSCSAQHAVTASRRISIQSGFATVEALVASAIVALSIISLYGGVSFGFGLLETTRENLRATQILQEKLELIRLYTWDQINTAGFVPNSFTEPFIPGGTNVFFTGSIVVTNAATSESYDSNLRRVTVTVSWPSIGQTKVEQMETLVSRYGIQNYIL